jgi:hypothetical protein
VTWKTVWSFVTVSRRKRENEIPSRMRSWCPPLKIQGWGSRIFFGLHFPRKGAPAPGSEIPPGLKAGRNDKINGSDELMAVS